MVGGQFRLPRVRDRLSGAREYRPALSAASADTSCSASGKAWAACLERPSVQWTAVHPALGAAAGNPVRRPMVPRGNGCGAAPRRGGAFPMWDRTADVDIIGTAPPAGQGRYQEQNHNQRPHTPSIGPGAKILYPPPGLILQETTRLGQRSRSRRADAIVEHRSAGG